MTGGAIAAEKELACSVGLWWMNSVITALRWAPAASPPSSLEVCRSRCLLGWRRSQQAGRGGWSHHLPRFKQPEFLGNHFGIFHQWWWWP